MFAERGRRMPDVSALACGDGLRTWAQLAERSAALRAALASTGITAGDRVAAILPNSLELAEIAVACALGGFIFVPLNPRLRADDLGFALGDAEPSAVFAPEAPAWPGSEALLVATVPPARIVRSGLAYERFIAAGAGSDAMSCAASDDAPFTIVYTSGTTGTPKGVVLDHASILWNARALAHALALDEGDTVLTSVPMFHIFGLSASFVSAAVAGARNVLLAEFKAGAALEAVARERVSVLHGVPTMFALLLDEQRRSPRDLATLRTGIIAGAPCPPVLVERVWKELGCDVRVSYGLTECAPAVTMTYADDPHDVRLLTVGRALPGIKLSIETPGPRGEGELLVRGPSVFGGYWRDPEPRAATFTAQGCLRTGDIAHIDAGGVVRFVGRRKELIVRGGHKIAPAEVEAPLLELEWVGQVALVGYPDAVLGERSCACVVPAAGVDVPPGPLALARAALADRLAEYKLPDALEIFETFPQTGSGKVQRAMLREWVRERLGSNRTPLR